MSKKEKEDKVKETEKNDNPIDEANNDANKDSKVTVENVDENAKLAEEYKALVQRVQADFDNYKRRNNEAIKIARNDGINDVIMDLLPVLDNCTRGLEIVKDENEKSGLELLFKQIMTLFEKYEVKEIEALDKDFDPNFHHAIAQCEDKEKTNKVVEVFQKGYIRKDKVLRVALVKVAQ